MLQSVEAHLGSRQVARVIYGSIIGLALVVALEAHPPSAGAVLATLWATALAVGLAELYSDVVGTETRTRRRIARRSWSTASTRPARWRLGSPFRESSSSSPRWGPSSSTPLSPSRSGQGWP